MPASLLHFLAVAPLHFKRSRLFDITALFYSSVAVDLEIGYSFLLGGSLGHGMWHSYLFVLTIYPVAVSLFVYAIERWLEGTIFRVYRFSRFYPDKARYPFWTIYLSCLIGGVSHIFFDMWTHPISSYVLFPIVIRNPFWVGDWASYVIFVLLILISSYTIFLWVEQMRAHRRIQKSNFDS